MSTISQENNSYDIIDNHALFVNRTHASTLLAEELKVLISNIFRDEADNQERRRQELVILAIPRGGVITGDVIASALDTKLDVIVSRKIGAPHNPELAI